MLLNPSYKPPAGYKPVYKEAKLFIPVSNAQLWQRFSEWVFEWVLPGL
jgi:hypothetical protein